MPTASETAPPVRPARHGRSPIHQEHLLATDVQARAGVHGLPGFDIDGHLHRWRGSGSLRRGPALDCRLEGRRATRGSLWPTGHGRGRNQDGLLLIGPTINHGGSPGGLRVAFR